MINEKFFLSEIGIIAFLIFNTIKSDMPNKYDFNYIKKYLSNNIINNKKNLKIAINDVKNKIKNDNQIINKQELYNLIDSSLYLEYKNDFISKSIFKSSNKYGESKAFMVPLKYKNKTIPLIGFKPQSDINTIRHELLHIVETYMKTNKKIDKNDIFDFNQSNEYYSNIFSMLTNFEFKAKIQNNIKIQKYLTDYNYSEVYVRLNNFKFFLYKYNFIDKISDPIDDMILLKLYSGKLYKELPNDQSKKEFRQSDFIIIFIFFNRNKLFKINQLTYNSKNIYFS